MQEERLNKYLADCGICSRREADRMIGEGRVLVNGQTAQTGMKVSGADEVTCNGEIIHKQDDKVVLAYYKPVGVTCTEKDRHAEITVKDAVDYPVRVTYAGRLDRDSEGLLLLTNDGDLINRLMRAANFHEKEYLVKTNKPLTKDFIEKMGKGVFLKDLDVTTRPCKIEVQGKFTFKIILTQGLNRQIRRMCRALGFDAASIKRIRVANIMIRDLKPGSYRRITGEEREELYRLINGKAKPSQS